MKTRVASDPIHVWCEGVVATLKWMYTLPNALWRESDAIAICRFARMAVLSSVEGVRRQVRPDIITPKPDPKLSGSYPSMTSFLQTRCVDDWGRRQTDSSTVPRATQSSSSSSSAAVVPLPTVPSAACSADNTRTDPHTGTIQAQSWSSLLGDNRRVGDSLTVWSSRSEPDPVVPWWQQDDDSQEVWDAHPWTQSDYENGPDWDSQSWGTWYPRGSHWNDRDDDAENTADARWRGRY